MAQWHSTPAERVADLLDVAPSNPPRGLTGADAEQRLAEHGRNELAVTEPPSALAVAVSQFKSPMIAFLMACAVITAIEREWVDTGAIILILLLNAVVGFWQERKAERDVRALQSMATTTARAWRDGQQRELDAAELVPGDLVDLESGDRVPADVRLVEVSSLRVDESMFTGEVLPVEKSTEPVDAATETPDQTSMAFSGTLVVSGRARGLVVETGAGTQIGAINELVQGPAGKTPLQHLSERLEKMIGLGVLVVAVAIGVAGVATGSSVSEMFRTVVALIVSAMPEALPIVLTIAMGYGVSQMARRHAVVRRLPSVETLGSTTVIGSDKTGTLTRNRLTVERVWTADGFQDLDQNTDGPVSDDLLTATLAAGARTNEARLSDGEWAGDAVDVAMASAAYDLGVLEQGGAGQVVADMPYEPDLGFSQTVREVDGARVLYVKGAPEKVLEASTGLLTAQGDVPLGEHLDAVREANESMAREGLRVIATAHRRLEDGETVGAELDEPRGLVLTGLQGMVDPPRDGVLEAVADCRRAGIHVMMITGDHPVTARAIGERLGFDTEADPITGSQMREMDDEALATALQRTAIAARMTPQDKLRIVELLQERGDTVAVTGDGVNDAPALRAASIGVAMGRSGTDVAREASDVVLTDDNFATIVHAVEQGRVTFAAIRKATHFLLTSALATLVAVAVNTFTDHPLIFLPVMLLWVNIVMNGVQDVAMAFEPGEGDELEQAPRSPDEGILDRVMWVRTAIVGLLMAALTLFAYDRSLSAGLDLDHARTLALTTLVMANFFQILCARTERRSAFAINHLRNPLLLGSSVVALVLHWSAMAVPAVADLLGLAPLTVGQWLQCLVLGASVLVVVELDKLVRRRRR